VLEDEVECTQIPRARPSAIRANWVTAGRWCTCTDARAPARQPRGARPATCKANAACGRADDHATAIRCKPCEWLVAVEDLAHVSGPCAALAPIASAVPPLRATRPRPEYPFSTRIRTPRCAWRCSLPAQPREPMQRRQLRSPTAAALQPSLRTTSPQLPGLLSARSGPRRGVRVSCGLVCFVASSRCHTKSAGSVLRTE
jgi:hypothetical protein